MSLDPSEFKEFVHIDDEDNEEYATDVLKYVEELLETMKIAKTAMDDDGDVNTQDLNVGLENGVIYFRVLTLFISMFLASRSAALPRSSSRSRGNI